MINTRSRYTRKRRVDAFKLKEYDASCPEPDFDRMSEEGGILLCLLLILCPVDRVSGRGRDMCLCPELKYRVAEYGCPCCFTSPISGVLWDVLCPGIC
jgi:hypothetical protein